MCGSKASWVCGHEQSQLISESDSTRTPCGGCLTSMIGPRFRCGACSLTLHPLCKARPASISTFLHPQHPLSLVTAAGPTRRRCNLCLEPIEGVYYTCLKRPCDFDVHPQCSQISPRVTHVLDSRHALHLQHRDVYSTRCNVCLGDCGGWAYRCQLCHVDVHFWCLWKPAAVDATSRNATTTRTPFYFGHSDYVAHNNAAVPYWWPGNYTTNANTSTHFSAAGSGSGSGSGFGVGSSMGVMNITGSLAVNLLSTLTSNFIQNGFLF